MTQYMRGSRNFRQGGGGQGQSDKKAPTTFFFLFFVVLSFTEVKWSISKKYIIFQGSRGGPTLFFREGGGGESNCLIPIETHIICDFPGVVRTPCPPPPSGSALAIALYFLPITAAVSYRKEHCLLTVKSTDCNVHDPL